MYFGHYPNEAYGWEVSIGKIILHPKLIYANARNCGVANYNKFHFKMTFEMVYWFSHFKFTAYSSKNIEEFWIMISNRHIIWNTKRQRGWFYQIFKALIFFSGFRNFAKEFEDVLQSKQDAQELFSSSAVALPLVAFASFLLLRDPLVNFLEGITCTLYEITFIA